MDIQRYAQTLKNAEAEKQKAFPAYRPKGKSQKHAPPRDAWWYPDVAK